MFLVPQKIVYYVTKSGKSPFIEWFEDLDFSLQTIIRKRIRRLELGNFGDCESLGDGVFELKMHIGAGYRIYFGREKRSIILLIMGGDKSTQNRDIKKAKLIWEDCQNDKK